MIRRFSIVVGLLLVSLGCLPRAGAQTGTGLTGRYYDTSSFGTLVTTRTDTTVNFDWGTAIPSGTAITHPDYFSSVWTGQIEPEFTEPYVFFVSADDSATLWVNDQVVCHRSFPQSGNPAITGQIKLEAGKKVNIRLEYAEQTASSWVKLEWASASRPREVVPGARLYPSRVAKAGGSLLKENWLGIAGPAISSLTASASYPNKPAGREFITTFECLAQNWADNYGARVTGFIVPQVTGSYTFAASGDETVELWLSTDANPSNKSKVASVAAPTAFRQWDANPATQQSTPRTLVQGQRYYVELLHKESTGSDHWSVGWKKPGDTAFSVIPGEYLLQAGLDRTQPAQAAICDTMATGHPRLYATDERFARLRALWQSGTPGTPKFWTDAIIAEADAVLPTAPVTYPLNVDTARVVMNNMYKLGLAWQMTNDSKYPERAYTELAAVAAFADWFDGRTLLYTSETTHGFAIAYDWMHSYWTQPRRDTIRTAIINKGLNPALSLYKSNFWALRTNSSSANWNIVCNSGIATGALAVGTESETLCEDILARSMNSMRPNLVRFTTDQGGLHEGPTYLEYAQRYAVRGLAGLEWSLGSDFGLSATQGFSETATFPIYTAGPSNVTFAASDDAESSPRRGWLWPWSARRFNQPTHNAWSAANTKPIALDVLWHSDGGLTPVAAGSQPDLAFKGESGTPFKSQDYVAMRGSWKDPRTTFVAAKAGEILTSHGHYDVGTFALDALGKRWFRDLGKELYAIGVPATDLYRYRAEGHNTLVIDPGAAAGNLKPSNSPLVAFQAKAGGAGAFSIYNLTAAHGGVTRVWRGFRLIGNRREVLVQDEIQASTGKNVWWFAHYAHPSTVATLGPDGTSVMLTQGAERLWCKIASGGGTFQIMDAAPLPSSPDPAAQSVNSGHRKIAINLANVTNTTLAVWFVPLEAGEPTPATLPSITPLNTWQIDSTNYPPTVGGSQVLSANNQPVDIDLSTLAEDDNTPAAALVYAVSNAQAGSVVLLGDGRTARFTPTPGASGFAGFDFAATDSGGVTGNVATITVGGLPVTHTWNSPASGNWSAAANWSGNAPPASYRGSELRFLTAQTVSGTLTATNDIAGTLQANRLSLNGAIASGGSATVTLGGNPLQFVANGPDLPAISLAGQTSGYTYNVNNPIELAADTTFTGSNSGRVNFNGVISGTGGFTRTGSFSTVYFGNNNTYQGPTVIGTAGLTVGLSGSTSTVGSLGLGGVTTSGTITFQRANAYHVTNPIGGTGGLVQFGTGTLTLNPENTYSGSTQIYAGVLVASSLNSVNGGDPLLPASSLGAPTTVATGTIGLASGASATLRYAGTGETTDRVINLRSTASGTIEQAGTGLLKFTSNFTATGASTKTLTLSGSTAGIGELAGVVVDNSPTNRTNLAKSGTGTWTLAGSNSYTGTTSVNAGTLVVDGSIASPSPFTVGSGARLAGDGAISSPLAVTGTLAPGSPFGLLTAANTVSFGAASRFTWELGGNAIALADRLDSGALTITGGAKIDLVLNRAGSSVNFLHSFWRTARSFPLVNAASVTGSFSLGTISSDSGGRTATTYGSFTLQHTSTGVNLLWSPIAGFPVIDDPTLTLISPAQNVVSLVDAALSLRLAATVGGGAGTSLAWTQVSGPGTASFADPAASDTRVGFTAPGTYLLRGSATNPIGSSVLEITVHVAQPTSIVLREGVEDYSHQATFVRGDGGTWNSGARNQMLVGRTNAPFRALLSFDIPALEPGFSVEGVSLDLWVAEAGTGTGTLGTLQLRRLLTTFLEGAGNGTSASNGTGSGTDWTTRTGDAADPWTTSGLGSGTDYDPTVLASLSGLIPATLGVGTQVTLGSTGAALKDAVTAAAGSTEPLGLLLTSATDTTLANHFLRLASNDHATPEWRPQLTLQTSNRPAPEIHPGSAPAAVVGAQVPLNGSVSGGSNPLWTLVSGPGAAFFGPATAPVTSVMFSHPGTYTLRLGASNSFGETSRTIVVTATGSALTNLEVWRQQNFSTTVSTGDAADSADPDRDGLANLLEFATGHLPDSPDGAITSLTKSGSTLDFTYRRSHAAIADGITFAVERSDTLGNGWSVQQVTQQVIPGTDNGISELWKATLPKGNAHKRFVRVRITPAP